MRASDWAGIVGETWAEEWVRTDRTFAPVDAVLVSAVARRLDGVAAPRILDIGCGAGRTSLSLAGSVPAASITGIDLSPALVAAARRRAGGHAATAAGIAADGSDCDGDGADSDPGSGPASTSTSADTSSGASPRTSTASRCRFAVADAQDWAEEDGFDLIVSRHGVMFFDDPVAALAHIRMRAAPGAPLLFSCFRAPALNPWASGLAALVGGLAASPVGAVAPDPPSPDPHAPDPHAPGPFAFADEAYVAGLLTAAGWHAPHATPLDFAYVAGAGADPVADAIGFFLRIGPTAFAMRHAEGADRQRLLDGLAALVAGHLVADSLGDGRIIFPAAAWIWSATA